MGIGAVDSMGYSSAIYGFSGYVYNPNRLTSKSLNKVQRISDDVLDGKLDVKKESAKQNENPLKVGETQNFEAVLEEQMYMGMNKAAMLFGL